MEWTWTIAGTSEFSLLQHADTANPEQSDNFTEHLNGL
jgi:hypothetical protein